MKHEMMKREVAPSAPSIVVAEYGNAFDAAMVALVEKCGHKTRSVAPERLSLVPAKAIVFADHFHLRRVVAGLGPRRGSVLIGLNPPVGRGWEGAGQHVTWIRGAEHAAELGRVLDRVAGAPVHQGAVHVSRREREVLTSYVLGSTVEVTASIHHIAVSTVKTHYRRVADRYGAAGRPVENKAQLLMEMVTDGWISTERKSAG